MTESLGITPEWHAAELAEVPALKEGELHLWWLPLRLSAEQRKEALTLLSEVQRDKYARRNTVGSQHAYLAGRYFLLHLLGAYNKQKPSQVELCYTRLNKPYLSQPFANLSFNFTDTPGHDCSYGLFGFALERAVGVDIEARRRRSDFAAIAKKRFTKREQDFACVNGVICPERFLAIWTRKEAYGKATGQGINFKMNQRNLINFDDPEQNEFKFSDEQNRDWRLLPLELGDEFIASVVHESHERLAIKAFNLLKI